MSSNQPTNISNTCDIGWKYLKTQLANQFGIATVNNLRTLENYYINLASIRDHIVFLKSCHRLGLKPKCFNLKSPIRSKNVDRILERASQYIVKEMKNAQYGKLNQIEEQITMTETEILSTCPSYKQQILSFLDETYRRKVSQVKTTQLNKLNKMLNKRLETHTYLSTQKESKRPLFLKNISSVQLTTNEENVLSLGMNFSLPKKCLINENIETILQIESGLARDYNLEEEDKNFVRREVSRVLNKHPWHIDESQKFKCITKSIREIKKRMNIMVVKAEKGNVTLIIDVTEYDRKINVTEYDRKINVKQNKYRSLSNDFNFVAVGVETSGVLGIQASKFLKELGRKLIAATGEPRSSPYLLQRISIAIQRGNSASILATHPKSRGFDEIFLVVLNNANACWGCIPWLGFSF